MGKYFPDQTKNVLSPNACKYRGIGFYQVQYCFLLHPLIVINVIANQLCNLKLFSVLSNIQTNALFNSQDKNRMSAHIKGQDSIIQGLRSERKLWGQELAQQGKPFVLSFICSRLMPTNKG